MDRPMSRYARVVVVVAVIAIVVLLVVRLERWLAVDRCLDAGGRWNDASRSCDHAPRG